MVVLFACVCPRRCPSSPSPLERGGVSRGLCIAELGTRRATGRREDVLGVSGFSRERMNKDLQWFVSMVP